jgi:hypothetical protein
MAIFSARPRFLDAYTDFHVFTLLRSAISTELRSAFFRHYATAIISSRRPPMNIFAEFTPGFAAFQPLRLSEMKQLIIFFHIFFDDDCH